MKRYRPWLWLCLALVSAPAGAAAEIGVATLVEGAARVLRGATWYKLVPGARLEDGDIVVAQEKTQVQVESATNGTLNVAGPATLYVLPLQARTGGTPAPLAVQFNVGWLKLAARAPGLRVVTLPTEITTADAILVIRARGSALELFDESGSARLTEALPNGAVGAMRESKRGEYWSKPADAPFTTPERPPKEFVDPMPRHFRDPLPSFADRFKAKPVLAVEGEISYAEAEPWLAGRDRSAFERRFASRLRDPAFRKAVEPQIARYPLWDRMLHPEKFAPKPAPAQ
jgi:hypothetical protein